MMYSSIIGIWNSEKTLLVLGSPNVMRGESIEGSRLTLDMLVGTFCLLLLVPTVIISWGEFRYIVDYFEYGGNMSDVWRWILYTATIISILLVSGLYFLGMLRPDSVRLGAGISVISISILNILSRFFEIDSEMNSYGIEEFWTDYLYRPSTHERLELVILGIIIGFFVIRSKRE